MVGGGAPRAVEELLRWLPFQPSQHDGYLQPIQPHQRSRHSGTQQFWVASGATSLLSKFIDNMEVSLDQFNDYVIELKLSKNGGIKSAAEQIKANGYTEPFLVDRRDVIALAVELDDMGKGLVEVERVE